MSTCAATVHVVSLSISAPCAGPLNLAPTMEQSTVGLTVGLTLQWSERVNEELRGMCGSMTGHHLDVFAITERSDNELRLLSLKTHILH